MPVLAVVVPRFSNVAFVSVLVLLGTGTGATIIHMPAVNALWDTGYGVAILVKIGLLATALVLGCLNLLRHESRRSWRRASDTERGESASRLLRRLISGEAVLVAGAVFVAALLSSLAPPPPSFALQNSALAKVGPGTGRRRRWSEPATSCRCSSRRTRPPPRTRSPCGSRRAASRCGARP